MRALSNFELVELWEQGSVLHPLDRGLLALSAVLPEVPSASLADWPLGRRNRLLFDLHCSCFGNRLAGWASCAGCGEKMEVELESSELLARNENQSSAGTVVLRGQAYRLPTTRAIAAAAQAGDVRAAEICVLEHCLLTAGESSGWSDEYVAELGELMAVADPMAETRVALRCPVCTHQQDEVLDIASFVWTEIEACARRLLWEIHALASTYGWSEGQILSLSAARRALYLQMVQA